MKQTVSCHESIHDDLSLSRRYATRALSTTKEMKNESEKYGMTSASRPMKVYSR